MRDFIDEQVEPHMHNCITFSLLLLNQEFWGN
jgi:hypothetical protein